jgi:ABC-type glutathione transport system ATPase component
VDIDELSDGYRSILSLTLDLLRRLEEAFGPRKLFADDGTVAPPGVVLIDEIDAHLHPTWQREVGVWFKRYFPRMQFLVATHSPLVCQAADSVFVLPRPGVDEQGRMLKGTQLDRLRYGNVLDAYSTGVFGRGVTRSEDSKQKLKRLASLNRKELESGLSDEEQVEQERLRAIMPTDAPVLNGARREGAA